VAGGYSLDMMNAMRQAVAVSRMREGSRMMDAGITARADSKLSINWKEALFLATRGGAMALGLQGIFGVGLPFDAQESELKQSSIAQAFFNYATIVKLYDPTSGVGIGALDYFDLEFESQAQAKASLLPPSLEEIEKWWCIGDVRNRLGMWIQGRRVFGAAAVLLHEINSS
jgi:guanine deaminase